MSVLNEFVAFLKDYNKLLEKGTKNIYDSTSYIWVDDILQLTGHGGCSSVIPDFFRDSLDRVSQILKIDKPVKPIIAIPNSFANVSFNEAKNIFESDSDETLDAFKASEDGKKEQIKIDYFKLGKKIYSKLFTAYNDTKNDSSREVTLSVALIQYSKNKEKKEIESVSKINQHLFHFPLKLDLSANNALTVSFTDEEKPFADFSFLNNTPIRKDALDNIIDSFEAGIETFGFKFIYESSFKNLISHTLQQIYVDSSFSDNLYKPASDQTKLNTFEISFAPAINAKIKKPRFFEKLTDSIIEYDKENKPEVPLINIILKDPNSKHNNKFVKSNYLTDTLFEETKEKYFNLEKDDFSIFFPLAYNKEQKEIFEKYQKNRLTVVTGPPGTGKSHSIVNILCNLLAQGQRVLITAQTDKALESLLDKIPKQFDSLLFTKIKLPNSDRFSLEHSIDNLTEILTSEKKIDINEKMSSLDKYKSTYVALKSEVYSILDNEYRVFDLSEHFKGLKNHEIFKKLISVNEKEWNWIEDILSPEILSQSDEIIYSLKSFLAYSENNIEKLNSSFDIESFKKEFSEFDFENYFDLHRRVKELKRELALSASVSNEQILSLSVDAIRPLLIEYDNSDIVIKDSQTLHRLLNSFRRLEENGDIKTNIMQSDLIKNRDTYTKDIQEYITLIPKDKAKLSFFNKIGNSKYKRVKYLEDTIVNDQSCVNRQTFNEFEKYILDLFNIDQKVKEIEKYSFKCNYSDSYSLNDKIASYNTLVKSIATNKTIIDLVENNNDLKHFIEVFDLYPYDIKAVYNKLNQIQSKFKRLQALVLEENMLVKRSSEINDKIIHSDVREYFNDYLPLINPEKESNIVEVKSRLKEISNKIWASRNYKKSETLLQTLLPNTFKNISNIDDRYLNAEAFEFCYAFQHLSKNALVDFQVIKEKLKYYFDKMTETKADILFDLAKTKFKNKFQPTEMEDFLKILHNFKYNQSQAVRGIQQNAKFKSLVRKNGIDISQRLSCWVMKFNDVLNSLGNTPEVFDCVIVDEASQLDFNSVLLSYYAKNMIVVGDDKQTSPSGLSGVGQEELGLIVDKNLSFMGDEKAHIRNDNSLFSLAKMVAGSSNLSLKEHFRCVPEIIAFSKNQFYPNSLRPLKQLNFNRLTPKVPIFVQDAFQENRVVMREIEAVKRYLIELFKNPDYDEKTIGVVSLGLADHTDRLSLITEELYEVFPKEKIEKHNLIIADAAKFQGDERDVMIISLGVALDIQKLSQNDEAKPARIRNDGQNLTDQLKSINVALSRAKEQMILFYSLKADQLKSGDFRIDIINFFKEKYSSVPELVLPPNISSTNRTRENTPPPFDSWFEYDIAYLLIQKGYLFIKPQHEVKEKELFENPRSGETTYVHFKLDLVVFSNGKSVAIECDGDPFHSSSEDVAYDIERQEFLERVGWKIYRILYSLFKKDATSEMNKLAEFIQRHTN